MVEITRQFLVECPSQLRSSLSLCEQEALIMRGPKPPSIQLTPRQLALLQRLIRRRSAPHQLVCRARLIVLASEGLNNSQISQQLSLYRGQVRRWRTRWLAAAPHLTTAEAADP